MSIALYRYRNGAMSAAVARYAGVDMTRSIGYNSRLKIDQIIPNEDVFLLGMAFDDSEMKELVLQAERVVLIDHHPDVLHKFRNETPIQGLEVIGSTDVATCVSVWNHFFPEHSVPPAVQAVGNYMLWQLDRPTLEFYYGLQLNELLTDCKLLVPFIDDKHGEYSRIMEAGRLIYEYNLKLNIELAEDLIYPTEMKGVKALACNYIGINSLMFNKADPEQLMEARIGVRYHWNPKASEWSVSISRLHDHDDIDLGKIAAEFGGGGAPGVAGFRCPDLPFEQKKNPIDTNSHNLDQYSDTSAYAAEQGVRLRQYIRNIESNRGWSQYKASLHGLNVAGNNQPTRNWDVNTRKVGAVDMKVSWVWDARGAYRHIFEPITVNTDTIRGFLEHDEHVLDIHPVDGGELIVHSITRLA